MVLTPPPRFRASSAKAEEAAVSTMAASTPQKSEVLVMQGVDQALGQRGIQLLAHGYAVNQAKERKQQRRQLQYDFIHGRNPFKQQRVMIVRSTLSSSTAEKVKSEMIKAVHVN